MIDKARIKASLLTHVVQLAEARKAHERARSDPARNVASGAALKDAEQEFERTTRDWLERRPALMKIIASEAAAALRPPVLDLRAVIEARIEHMAKLYELSGGVEHDGEMGAFREYFVAELLRPTLPDHFGIGSGVVADKSGQQSPQLDVIIYDRRLMPPLLRAGERGVYAIDAVLAACEVKSTLKAADYTQAGKAALSVGGSSLKIATPARKQPLVYPLFAVFGYTSDAKDKEEVERMREQISDDDGRDFIRLITVLDKGLWAHLDGAMKQEPYPERAGVLFVVHLLNRLEEAAESRGPFRLQDWVRF